MYSWIRVPGSSTPTLMAIGEPPVLNALPPTAIGELPRAVGNHIYTTTYMWYSPYGCLTIYIVTYCGHSLSSSDYGNPPSSTLPCILHMASSWPTGILYLVPFCRPLWCRPDLMTGSHQRGVTTDLWPVLLLQAMANWWPVFIGAPFHLVCPSTISTKMTSLACQTVHHWYVVEFPP